MNRITFAGKIQNRREAGDTRAYEIIVPDQRGELICGGGEKAFCRGNVIVIPPACACEIRGLREYLLIRIEQALLQCGKPAVIDDMPYGDIARAAEQAERYFAAGGGVLEALGGLITAYIAAAQGVKQLSPVVATVKNEIERNISLAAFSLEDYLKSLPLNYDYLRKLFRKETGVTPHEYMISLRMQLARGLLEGGISNRYSNYSVAQIAEACGFAEPLYFSRVFKKRFGVSPSYYLKK